MVLARPDIAVSVDDGSAPGLGSMAGLPTTRDALGTPGTYERLLRRVARQPRHRGPRPDDPWEAAL